MSEIDKILEGPFTYDIDRKLSLCHNDDDKMEFSANDQPVIALMYALMNIYNYTVKKNYDETRRKVLEVEELWKNLDMRRITAEKISTNVLKHIKDSTFYYFHLISGNKSKSSEIFERIIDSRKYTSNIELATLYGCRAIGWMSFYEAGHKEALNHAKQASAHCRDCPLWHFVLYKSYRVSRRKLDFNTRPSIDETSSILECTNLSKDPFYSLHAGQMYREAKDWKTALIMYRKVYDAKPKSNGILLKLALGLIRCRRNNAAKELLDQVEARYPNDPMFLHYKGIYLEIAERNYEAASEYYAKSAQNNNYPAHMQYARCRQKCDVNFDRVSHLRMMMEKFTDEEHTQQLLLHLAMNYFKREDFNEACECFTKAILINKNSNQLKVFNNSTIDDRNVNIFNFIKFELVPRCGSVDLMAVMKKLLDLCE